MINIYKEWLSNEHIDNDTKKELSCLEEAEINDRFYKDLEFGTGGLRGLMGAGTSRMNIYTVAKATRGLCAYLQKNSTRASVSSGGFSSAEISCAIAYDSRNNSRLFAEICACIMGQYGLRVMMFSQLAPTPLLSFATRYLQCTAGVVITASHNPAKYNGYKVYGPDGCQITVEAARDIQEEINKAEIFAPIFTANSSRTEAFNELVKMGKINFIQKSCEEAYFCALRLEEAKSPLKVVYSALNGAGNLPVRRALSALKNVDVFPVPEQEKPDGHFPTCPSPNPENKEAMVLAGKLCLEKKADLFFATDPDCDRLGVGIIENGKPRLLSGNELGVLMLDFICEKKKANGSFPEKALALKTIVTSEMASSVAKKHGVELINVLTGFKFIGEQISILEKTNELERFIFGFEESCGYLHHSHARDKDAISSSALLCEMASALKAQGVTLGQALQKLQDEHGYFLTELVSYEFRGEAGMKTMEKIMNDLRSAPEKAGFLDMKKVDYLNENTGLPKSNVLQLFNEGSKLIVRPSGTEPKLKIYLEANAKEKEKAEKALEGLRKLADGFIL